jgi:hypothetical protein
MLWVDHEAPLLHLACCRLARRSIKTVRGLFLERCLHGWREGESGRSPASQTRLSASANMDRSLDFVGRDPQVDGE